jgi:hypothetical protein
MQTKIDYDYENDILYFYPNDKGVDYSIDYDDIILEEEVEKLKQVLNSIKEAYMKIEYKPHSVRVKIGFTSIQENVKEGMLIQVPIKKEMMVNV